MLCIFLTLLGVLTALKDLHGDILGTFLRCFPSDEHFAIWYRHTWESTIYLYKKQTPIARNFSGILTVVAKNVFSHGTGGTANTIEDLNVYAIVIYSNSRAGCPKKSQLNVKLAFIVVMDSDDMVTA